MRYLRKIKEKFVETSNKTLNFLLKNKNAVYSTCITVLLCGLWSISVHIKTKAAVLGANQKTLIVINESEKIIKTQQTLLKEQDDTMVEVFDILTKQSNVINKLEDELNSARQQLWRLDIYYKALIEYMKKIGEWPPKEPPPIRPDNIT